MLGILLLCGLEAQGLSMAQQPRIRRSAAANPTAISGALTGTFRGVLKHLDNKEIVLLNDDEQVVVIRRSKKTKFFQDGKEVKAKDIAFETRVLIDAVEDVDLKPIATRVSVEPKVEVK